MDIIWSLTILEEEGLCSLTSSLIMYIVFIPIPYIVHKIYIVNCMSIERVQKKYICTLFFFLT